MHSDFWQLNTNCENENHKKFVYTEKEDASEAKQFLSQSKQMNQHTQQPYIISPGQGKDFPHQPPSFTQNPCHLQRYKNSLKEED